MEIHEALSCTFIGKMKSIINKSDFYAVNGIYHVAQNWKEKRNPFHVSCYTSIKIIKNEVGCRDDTVPKTVDTRRHCEEE